MLPIIQAEFQIVWWRTSSLLHNYFYKSWLHFWQSNVSKHKIKLTFQYWKPQNFQLHHTSSCSICATAVTVQKTGSSRVSYKHTTCLSSCAVAAVLLMTYHLPCFQMQNKHNTTYSTRLECTQTFVKVVLPLVIFPSTMEIVGNVTSYCYGEHKRGTDPERTYSDSIEHTHGFNGIFKINLH